MLTPSYTYYTDSLPEGVGGTTKACVIAIKTKYKDDKRIRLHELEHVRQFWSMFAMVSSILVGVVYFSHLLPLYYLYAILSGVVMHSVLYDKISKYRLWAEAKAYAIQTKPDRSDLDVMAYRLSFAYQLNISQEEAKTNILKYL